MKQSLEKTLHLLLLSKTVRKAAVFKGLESCQNLALMASFASWFGLYNLEGLLTWQCH